MKTCFNVVVRNARFSLNESLSLFSIDVAVVVYNQRGISYGGQSAVIKLINTSEKQDPKDRKCLNTIFYDISK